MLKLIFQENPQTKFKHVLTRYANFVLFLFMNLFQYLVPVFTVKKWKPKTWKYWAVRRIISRELLFKLVFMPLVLSLQNSVCPVRGFLSGDKFGNSFHFMRQPTVLLLPGATRISRHWKTQMATCRGSALVDFASSSLLS